MDTNLPKDRVLSALRRIDSYVFEEFIAEVWKGQNYNTKTRRGSGDRGIDVIATKGTQKELLQVKRYSANNKIGSQEVRRYATLYQQVNDADQVVIISSGFFSEEAKSLGRDLDVELINGDKLFNLIQNFTPYLAEQALQGKYPSESPNLEQKHPFDDPNKFDRISANQGLFDSCPKCVRGHIWLGQLENNDIRLKCERCDSMWKEEKEDDGWWIFTREKTVGWIEI